MEAKLVNMPKIVELGLDLDKITMERLEEIANLMELYIREYIFNKLSGRLEQLNVTLSLEVTDVLRIKVDVEIIGKSKGRIDYDTLIDEAIREAYRKIEEVLRGDVRRNKGENTESKDYTARV